MSRPDLPSHRCDAWEGAADLRLERVIATPSALRIVEASAA
jgi:hypothetical protein